jgi:hypothetical protein
MAARNDRETGVKGIGKWLVAMCLSCGALAAHASVRDWSRIPEDEAFSAIPQEATAAYRAGDFPRLEAELLEYVSRGARTASGLWVGGFYTDGIETALLDPRPQTAGQWDALERRTLDQTRQYPQSALARLLHAKVLIARAWSIRGRGYANTVPESAWKPFHDGLRRADEYLVQEKQVAGILPEYYVERIGIARGLGRSRSEIDALLEASDRVQPGYYPAYFSVLEYLLPKWHGDALQVEAFARAAVQRTRRTEGDSMYARIYWVASQSQYGSHLFYASDAQWALMRSGFEDVVKRYPDAWNYQNYAHFACEAGDDRTLERLLSQHVQEPILPDAWTGETDYEECGRRVGRLSL